MKESSLLQIPYGVQCFYGRAAHLRRAVERRVTEVFDGWSYEEILLPLFDHFEVFARGGGPIDSDHIYRFIGRNGEILALRPDFTALVAKVVASRMQDAALPLRLFYTGEVLRYQPPEAGRREDLFQIGLEHIGDGLGADLEVVLIAMEALDHLGVDNAVLTVGHAGFVLGLLEEAGIPASARPQVLEAMRARDTDRVHRLMGRQLPEWFMKATQASGGAEVLKRAHSQTTNPASLRAVQHLEMMASELEELSPGNRFQFDLGEVLGFDYYTGMVFEIHAAGLGLPLGGGGRYDTLIGKFGSDRPAVGFSLSLDRLAQVVASAAPNWVEKEAAHPVRPGGTRSKTLSQAISLRNKGHKVRLG